MKILVAGNWAPVTSKIDPPYYRAEKDFFCGFGAAAAKAEAAGHLAFELEDQCGNAGDPSSFGQPKNPHLHEGNNQWWLSRARGFEQIQAFFSLRQIRKPY